MKKIKSLCLVVMLGLVMLLLCSCAQAREKKEREMVTSFTLAAASETDLQQLDLYPNLTEADLRGSTCYEAVMAYIASHPGVQVTYDVAIGGRTYPMDTQSLVLEPDSFQIEELMERIHYLEKLSAIELPRTTLSPDLLGQLQAAFPRIDFS